MKRLIIAALVAIAGAFTGITAQNVYYDITVAPKDTVRVPSKFDPIPGPGYSGAVTADVLAVSPYGGTAVGVTTSHGVMLQGRYFFGAGTGYLRDIGKEMWMVPLYAEGRIYFKSANRRIYPNIGLRLGGMLVPEGPNGFYGTLTGGVRVPLGKRLGLIGEVGPQITSKYEREGYATPYRSNGTRFGFTVRVGLSF